jgi:hypothetical protein
MIALLRRLGIFLINVTNRHPDELRGQVRMHTANALLGFVIAEDPA